LNKIDLLTPEQKDELASSTAKSADNGPVLVSGMTGAGIDELLRRIDVALPVDPVITLSLRLPLTEGRTLALVHAMGRVLSSAVEDSHMVMEAEVPVSIAKRLRLSQYAGNGTSRPAIT
jgi:GTP-binding protein HflX